MVTGAEMLFVAKCLAWRMEKPEKRTVSMSFAHYGLVAYLLVNSEICEPCYARNEGSFEEAVKRIQEKEEAICQNQESCEEQNSVISSDAEPSGITHGTNA